MLEAVIITVTSALLALIAIVPSIFFQAWSLTAAGLHYDLVVTPVPVLGFLVGGALITTLTTILPTLPARRVPEPRVISRLVAE
ncbi:MAG: hypothetical protein ACK5H2_11845 [Beutenbergiaceae bacterium]